MRIKVFPSKVEGSINIPPSKSLLHRSIIAASLSNGVSTINNVTYSDDINATLNAVANLGVKINKLPNKIIVEGIDVNKVNLDEINVDVNQSGSTLRFLIPLFSLLANTVEFRGRPSLFRRPLDEYKEIFDDQKLVFNLDKDRLITKGKLRSGNYVINTDKSSQFITGLLLALPLLNGDSTIKIEGKKNSFSFITLTIDVLNSFGIRVDLKGDIIYIKGNQRYISTTYNVEGDYSLAAFYAVLGSINNDLKLLNLNHNSHQGDSAIIQILKNTGSKIEQIENGYVVKKSDLTSLNCSIKDCIDLGPILIIASLFAKKESSIKELEALIYKESNRLESIMKELEKFGCNLEYKDEVLHIKTNDDYLSDELILTYEDHRLVMAFTLLAACLKTPVIIDGVEAVNKSYPNFLKDIKKIGINYILD
jgi:3-phosphoshikimate 1-carboxyvinyltransferase